MANLVDADPINLYSLLNLQKSCNTVDVQRSYKQLSRHFHPDKNRLGYGTTAQQTFVQLQQAHDILTDPILRIAYDVGGLLAVKLVQRSQDHNHAKKNSGQHNTEVIELSLYEQMQQLEPHEAIQLVQQALDDYYEQARVLKEPQWDASIEAPLYWDASQWPRRDAQTLQISSRRNIYENTALTLGSTAQYQRNAMVTLSHRVSLEHKSNQFTQYNIDLGLNPSTSSPNLALRTSRRLSNHTFAMVALAGVDRHNWVYTCLTSRPLLVNEERVMATWRLSMKPSGQLQVIMATLRSSWAKIRIAIGSSPLKLTYYHSQWSFSWTWNIVTSAFKASRTDERVWQTDWSCKYGIKYDSSDWSLVLKLFNDHWNIKFPVYLSKFNQTPLLWMITVLISQCMDDWLQTWSSAKTTESSSAPPPIAAVSPHMDAPFGEIMRQVARKKRELEEASDGLVILQANWDDSRFSSVDALQYWSMDGQIDLPQVKDLLWWRSTSEAEQQPTLWDIVQSLFSSSSTTPDKPLANMYIRYQWKANLYEITLKENEELSLPSPKATRLGPVGMLI